MTKFEAWVLRWLLNRLINSGKGCPLLHVKGIMRVLFMHLQTVYYEDNVFTTAALMKEAVDEIQNDLIPIESTPWFKRQEENHENRCF